jgi:hypothetical protein
MHLVERSHTYSATTSAGGHGGDLNAPLEESDLDWQPGGTC